MQHFFGHITWLLCLGVLLGAPVMSHTEDRHDGLDFDMPETHIEVHVRAPDAVPKPDLLPDDVRDDTTPPVPDDPIEALHHEVQTLRDELRMLQSTLDLMVNRIMEDLREENVLLRDEVRRLHNMQEYYGLPDMTRVPRPGMALFDELLYEDDWAEEFPYDEYAEDTPEEPAEPFDFTPLHEWGRTPEMAARLGDDAVSLLGLVGVVPRGSRREDIEALGRELRAMYADYDNINIEVFDDIDTAERFIETEVGDPARRVLSVSKHAAADRDVILYLEDGEAHEVTQEPADDDEAE